MSDELITRDELCAQLKDRGLNVPVSAIRFWEYARVLPKPIKKWDPVVRAMRVYYSQESVCSIENMILRKPCPKCKGDGFVPKEKYIT